MKDFITLILKPTSDCNFRCAYCYHADTHYQNGFMSYEILEKTIKTVQSEYHTVSYVWHGGEPLLCGIDFFKEAIALQKKYLNNNKIINSVQTNGSLLDDEYITFFKENDFSVCVSFDGEGKSNSLREHTALVYQKILRAKKNGLPVAALSVVNSVNIDQVISNYNFFKELDVHTKFNPIFTSTGIDCSAYLITPEKYAEAMIKLFDCIISDTQYFEIEPIYEYINMYFCLPGRECIYESCLMHWIGITSDGSLYPCGRSYTDEYMLGNILDFNKISDVFLTESYINLMKQSITRRSACQSNCEYYGLCHGGCNNNCLLEGKKDVRDTFMCKAFQTIYSYIRNRLDQIVSNHIEVVNPYLNKLIQEKRKQAKK